MKINMDEVMTLYRVKINKYKGQDIPNKLKDMLLDEAITEVLASKVYSWEGVR